MFLHEFATVNFEKNRFDGVQELIELANERNVYKLSINSDKRFSGKITVYQDQTSFIGQMEWRNVSVHSQNCTFRNQGDG
jgi:hypothetical protein